jgi:Tfp pilus assembly protein PilZ
MDDLVPDCRRKVMRVPYSGTVRYSADQFNWYLNRARNVSKKGIFIKTEEKFTVGTKLYLNFDLTVDGSVVKKIRTIGEVVRLADHAKEVLGNKPYGLGIYFSLLPSQDAVMKSFVGGCADSFPERSSPLSAPSKQVSIGVQEKPVSLLKWWLQEGINKLLSTNGLILELTVILIVIVVGVIIFA